MLKRKKKTKLFEEIILFKELLFCASLGFLFNLFFLMNDSSMLLTNVSVPLLICGALVNFLLVLVGTLFNSAKYLLPDELAISDKCVLALVGFGILSSNILVLIFHFLGHFILIQLFTLFVVFSKFYNHIKAFKTQKFVEETLIKCENETKNPYISIVEDIPNELHSIVEEALMAIQILKTKEHVNLVVSAFDVEAPTYIKDINDLLSVYNALPEAAKDKYKDRMYASIKEIADKANNL